jgi:outer membrane murein-binding lipoprotein Lpp
MRYFILVLAVTVIASCSEPAPEDQSMDDSIKQMQKRMDEFNNRTKYLSLDVETLRSIPDDKLEQAIADYVIYKLDGDFTHANMRHALSEGNLAFWLTWIVDGDVNNGGFNQYYWNNGDEHNPDAVAAFELFGAAQHAALMRQANALRERERAAISEYQAQNALDAFSESYEITELGPLDNQYYELEEDLYALRIAKIRQSPELFTGESNE